MTDICELSPLETHDGAQLFCQRFVAESPRATIISLHDFGQHSGVYQKAHESLRDCQYSVYTLDLRGHGKSAGDRGNISHFDDYLDDLDLLVARVKEVEGERPIFLLGQGMGSLIALQFVKTRRPKFHGLILCGGLPLLPTKQLEKMVAQYAGIFLSRIEASDDAKSILFSETKLDEKGDELIYRGAVKARTVAEINSANVLSTHEQEFLPFPVLCLAAERHLTLMEKLHDKLLTHDKSLVEYHGKSLQPLSGEEREQVCHEIVKWCDGHLETLEDDDEWGDPDEDAL